MNEQILKVLAEQPGLKAREIATMLNTDKKDINSFLYGVLKNKCVQDKEYGWYLRKDTPNLQTEINENHVKTALTDLSHYYLACLGQSDEGGISVFAESKYGADYVELDSLPKIDNNFSFDTEGVQELLGKIRKDRNKLELYLGYPTTLKKLKSRKSSWEGMMVEPILLFPIEIIDGAPQMTQGFPIFNLSVIKRFTNAEREQVMDELVQLESELGLDSEDTLPELDDLVQRLESIRREWPWKESIEPDNFPKDPPLKSISEEGIYNRAVLIVGERSPFTQGLESELKSLSTLPTSDYETTALGQWINGQVTENEDDTKLPLLEVLPLNSEQRVSIQHSLTSPLTIITGPPGTGKSQVVTNLLINATWQGKRVLFASKNNKAVDVVDTRINNLGVRPVLLRMGSGVYQKKLAEYLMGLLTSTSTEHDQEEFDLDKQRYEKFEELFLKLEQEEIELIRLRNETDEISQSVEKIRKDILVKEFNYLAQIDLYKFKKAFSDFQFTLKQANKAKQGFWAKLFWDFIKEERYEIFQSTAKK